MKSVFLILLLSFATLTQAASVVLEGLNDSWVEYQKSNKVKDFGSFESSRTVDLEIGESFIQNEPMRSVQVLSSEVLGKTIKISIEFPSIIMDIDDIPVIEETDYKVISRSVHLAVDKNHSYNVEIYGVHSLRTSKGHEIKRRNAELFARFKMLSTSEWLRSLKKCLEEENSASSKFAHFLDKRVPEFKTDSLTLEELGAKLQKLFKTEGFDLILLPGSQDPDDIKRYTMEYENVSILELVQRVSYLQKLKYRLGKKGAVIARSETFKKSKAISSKNGLDLPGIKVDVKNKQLILDAKVCLSSGILEYLMCLPNSFEHESVFMTKVKPELVHMGLLLINSRQMPYKNRSEFMKNLTDNKSRLKIEVQWKEKRIDKKVDLHKMLIDRSQKESKKTAEDLWFFAGSYFTDRNVYAANIHQSLISLQQHPASVIHYGRETLDPYKSRTGGFEVNELLCPPLNSEVQLIFTAYK